MTQGLPTKVHPNEPAHRLYEGIEYKEFWRGEQRLSLDELEHRIVRKMLPVTGQRIIDVGCGYGRLADCYLDRFHQVVMVDGSMSLLRQAVEKTCGRAIYIASDATRLPFRLAIFDTILMIRVFHHIEDSRSSLSVIQRVLCSGGRFIFSYRNKSNLLRVLQWLVKKNPENPFTLESSGVGTTLISHHPKAVDQMLHEYGFSKMEYAGAGVVDWLAGKIGLQGSVTKLSELLAPLFGSTKIAPWILCNAFANGNNLVIQNGDITTMLICPACGDDVSRKGELYKCKRCDHIYPVQDGIIDMRI